MGAVGSIFVEIYISHIMLGDLIGAGMKAGGAIFGGLSASRAMKKVRQNIGEQRRLNREWYDMQAHEDATQRADAVRMAEITRENMRRGVAEARGAAAVAGGSDAAVASAQSAGADAMAETAARIAVAGVGRKDALGAEYRQREAALTDQLNNMEMRKAENVMRAGMAVGEAGAGLADAINETAATEKNE